jgi:hypothetical protein
VIEVLSAANEMADEQVMISWMIGVMILNGRPVNRGQRLFWGNGV